MFTIIAAIGENYELGKGGTLIWNLPNDLKFFKENTIGKKIFMGKRTYESLPKRLPNREYYVLSNVLIENNNINIVLNLDEYIKENENSNDDIFVIGGGMVYKQLIPYTKRMILTQINATCNDADTFFPKFNLNDWQKQIISTGFDGDIEYKHVQYIKK